MIHSKEKNEEDIIEFCEKNKSFENRIPLIVVPSTFAHITEKEFKDLDINIVIYGNHLIRSAYPSIEKASESIL